MTQATLAVPNAILFVLDPTNADTQVPEYVPGEPTAASPSCVSVVTLADVDGEALVSLLEAKRPDARDDLIRVFDGAIETPGRQLAIVTSQFDTVLQSAVAAEKTRFAIYVDDVDMPNRIEVDIITSATAHQRSGQTA